MTTTTMTTARATRSTGRQKERRGGYLRGRGGRLLVVGGGAASVRGGAVDHDHGRAAADSVLPIGILGREYYQIDRSDTVGLY